MPLDTSIPLQAKAPDPMQSLSSLLGVARGVQGMQAQKLAMTGQDQQNQDAAISLQERKALQGVLSDPTQWQNQDGTTDYNKLLPAVMKVAPTTGMDAISKIASTETQATASKGAIQGLGKAQRDQLGQIAYSLKGQPPDVVNRTLDEATKQIPGLASALPFVKQVISHVGNTAGQSGVDGALDKLGQMTQAVNSQQDMNTPNVMAVGTDKGTQLINTKPGASVPQGNMGAPMAPPNQFVTTPTGRMGVGNTASGAVSEPNPQGAAPVNLPVGETLETQSALQQQRDGARQAALSAPQLHDINRTILSEVDKGLNTGTLGQLTQKLSSATGFHLGDETSTGYNLLGKMLERSAATAAQSMGPHTNAGLESAIRQNGSLEYTPQAIKTIARLNDSLTTGAEKYHQGLEAAVTGSQNGVFAKRQFDKQWGQNADVNALKLLTATKTGDKEGAQEVLKAVGGPGSPGAKKLAQQLQNLQSLTTKGSL